MSSIATSLSETPEYRATNQSVELIGQARRELAVIAAAMNQQIADIKAEHELRAEEAQLAVKNHAKLVRDFCKKHRKELTRNDAVKYHDFPAGKVAWRKNPPSVSVAKKILTQIVASLRARKLAWAIRTTEEIDKDAILANPGPFADGAIDGIKVNKGGDNFVIEPIEVPLTKPALEAQS